MVASVAAGVQEKSDASPMHGVAFDANVHLLLSNLLSQMMTYEPVDLGTDDGAGNVSNAEDFTGIDNFFRPIIWNL